MTHLNRDEQGFTLMEVVVTVILVGLALPSLFILMGNLSYQTFQNRLMTNSVHLANSRLEEIHAYKDNNWDWFKNIENYKETESEQGFERVTNITHHENWESTGYEAYEVTVTVTHSKLQNTYSITAYLTKYAK